MDVPQEGKSEQTREIEAALSQRPDATAPKDDWDRWEDTIQAQVDKLLDDSRTLKLALLAVGGVSLMALGIGAMATKAAQQLMAGLNQLAENQAYVAQAIGLTPQQPDQGGWVEKAKVDVQVEPIPTFDPKEAFTGPNEGDVKIQDPKTFDVPTDAQVAPPAEGPKSEASAAAVAQMAEDKAAGIIDLAKEGEPE